MASEQLVPAELKKLYEVHEWRNAAAVLAGAYPKEWEELVAILRDFRLYKSDILAKGKGNKSAIAQRIDSEFFKRDWVEVSFDTKITVGEDETPVPTHKVDCFKNEVGVEVEWNNKDPFYDRDLNNFRLLFELRVIAAGVVITRSDEVQDIVDDLGKGKSFGASTTHMGKLLPKMRGGGAGGCPLLLFGITKQLYVPR